MKNSKGFTLIEVMLAVAIFSIAGVALIATTNTNFTNTILIEEKMYAGWIASNRLVEMKLENQWPPRNNKKGKEEFANQTWYWKQKVQKTTDNNLQVVVIEVNKNEKSDNIINSLATFVAKGG